MAVASPYWPKQIHKGKKHDLDSRIPFSLQNAMRCLAYACLQGRLNTNLSDRVSLNDSILLMNYWKDDLPVFTEKLKRIKPQLLFIGSMTLGIPGAVQLAKIAKKILGDKVFIVLGGKHINETVYLRGQTVFHHKSSPLLLMSQGKIPIVFDLVVSGDGEDVVLEIAQQISRLRKKNSPLSRFFTNLKSLETARGNWIVGWVEKSKIHTIHSKGIPLDRGSLPTPAKVFGVNQSNNFPIFGSGPTAHIYSDMGKGCVLDCFFCSERRSINGELSSVKTGARRLYKQLKTAHESRASSAFCDDSIVLGGNVQQLNKFADFLEEQPIHIRFGVQLTVSLLLIGKIQETIIRLSSLGLTYVYVGLETGSEKIAQTIYKCKPGKQKWIEKNRSAIEFITKNNIDFGVSVLFGIGESQADRLHLLELLASWQKQYQGNPKVVSLNWAVHHPLFNSAPYDFLEWGTPTSDSRLALFQELFGEASVRYCMPGVNPPTLSELREIRKSFHKLSLKN